MTTARWRRTTVAWLVVLGCVLAPLAVFAVWLRNQVVDTNRYVETVAPLSRNKAIDAAVADKVVTLLFEHVDVQKAARDALPEQARFLAGPLAGGLRGFTLEATDRVLASDQFHRLWVEANRLAHRQVVTLVRGGRGPITARHGKIVLDLSEVTRKVKEQLDAQGVTIFDKFDVTGTFELVDSKDLARASTGVRYLEDAALALPLLAVAVFAGALALSSDRRRTVVHGGLGLAAAMAVMSTGLLVGRAIFADAAAGHDVPRAAAVALFDTMVRFLRTGLRTAFALGAIAAGAAWVTGPSPAATRVRSTTRRLLAAAAEESGLETGPAGAWVAAHTVGLRIAAVAVGGLLLVWWDRPGPRGVVVVTVGVLVGLAAIELVGRAARRAASRVS